MGVISLWSSQSLEAAHNENEHKSSERTLPARHTLLPSLPHCTEHRMYFTAVFRIFMKPKVRWYYRIYLMLENQMNMVYLPNTYLIWNNLSSKNYWKYYFMCIKFFIFLVYNYEKLYHSYSAVKEMLKKSPTCMSLFIQINFLEIHFEFF